MKYERGRGMKSGYKHVEGQLYSFSMKENDSQREAVRCIVLATDVFRAMRAAKAFYDGVMFPDSCFEAVDAIIVALLHDGMIELTEEDG